MIKKSVYIRLRNRYFVKPNQNITLGNIAQIIAPDQDEAILKQLIVHKIQKSDKHLVVIDLMQVIRVIRNEFPDIEIRTLGNPEIIVEIVSKSINKKPNIFAVIFVWLLLFIGSGLAIMNFHHDVSMQEVHQRLYLLITGKSTQNPLLMQIPYSIGIGIGMILFFNHVFKKKINEEPSPLEVEMFLYQKNLDQYVVLNENKENWKNE